MHVRAQSEEQSIPLKTISSEGSRIALSRRNGKIGADRRLNFKLQARFLAEQIKSDLSLVGVLHPDGGVMQFDIERRVPRQKSSGIFWIALGEISRRPAGDHYSAS